MRYRAPLTLMAGGLIVTAFVFTLTVQHRLNELRSDFDRSVDTEIKALQLSRKAEAEKTALLMDALSLAPDLDKQLIDELLTTFHQSKILTSFRWWHEGSLRYSSGVEPSKKGLALAREAIGGDSTRAVYLGAPGAQRESGSTNVTVIGTLQSDLLNPDSLFLVERNFNEQLDQLLDFDKQPSIGRFAVYLGSKPEAPIHYFESNKNRDSNNTRVSEGTINPSYSEFIEEAPYLRELPGKFLDLKLVFTPAEIHLFKEIELFAWSVLLSGIFLTAILGRFALRYATENQRISSQVKRRTQQLQDSRDQLQESEERYKLVIESSAVGIWDHNVVTGTLFWSDRFASILGLSEGAFIGPYNDLQHLIHKDDQPAFQNALLNLRTKKQPLDIECRIIRENGGQFWARIRGIGQWDSNGTLRRMAGSIEDITERLAAQHELVRSNEELDNFAYIASHDLKEPLRAIFNHSKFLEEDYSEVIDDAGRDRIARMQLLAKRMEELISDLLYFSRLGRADEKPETTDLNRLVEELSELYVDENTIVETADKLPTVTRDRQRLSDLFRNLIGNAVKYNTSNPKLITIGMLPLVAGEKEPTFYIEDNGIGIDKKFFIDIFKIFKRLHPRDEYGGGTGSGLTFAKKIIEEWGGTIWLLSELNEGTAFYFTLGPSAKGKETEEPRREPKIASPSQHH